ncbi:hypothetical protein AB1Y20_016546 [Prymnesium parvum]|uniref:Uncharacterized protein n=1 Tax=Prymnesium parvum TaxID=97485 RepID=A0AB34IAZ0_PRYPA
MSRLRQALTERRPSKPYLRPQPWAVERPLTRPAAVQGSPISPRRDRTQRPGAVAGPARSPASACGITPAHFPPTLEGYSTYFERPSSRPSPRPPNSSRAIISGGRKGVT